MSEQKQVKLGYKFLGKTGIKVSELCLGTMTFSKAGKAVLDIPACDQKESHTMLDTFVAAGGNFIDTASAYHESEGVIGEWLAAKGSEVRESLIVATKGFFPRDMSQMRAPNSNHGNSRKNLKASLDRSLKLLQTDYVDLYQLHNWDSATPLRESLSVLNEMVQSGKVRYVGISNWCGFQIQEAMDICAQFGWEPLVTAQQRYNLLCRDIEWDSYKVTTKHGIAMLPFSPLSAGWLTGRYRRGMKAPEENTRVRWADEKNFADVSWTTHGNEHTWKIVDTLTDISKEVNATVSQVALRWLMQQPHCIPIFGASKLSHLHDNLGAATFKLSDDQMALLDKVSEKPLPYPFAQIRARARP